MNLDHSGANQGQRTATKGLGGTNPPKYRVRTRKRRKKRQEKGSEKRKNSLATSTTQDEKQQTKTKNGVFIGRISACVHSHSSVLVKESQNLKNLIKIFNKTGSFQHIDRPSPATRKHRQLLSSQRDKDLMHKMLKMMPKLRQKLKITANDFPPKNPKKDKNGHSQGSPESKQSPKEAQNQSSDSCCSKTRTKVVHDKIKIMIKDCSKSTRSKLNRRARPDRFSSLKSRSRDLLRAAYLKSKVIGTKFRRFPGTNQHSYTNIVNQRYPGGNFLSLEQKIGILIPVRVDEKKERFEVVEGPKAGVKETLERSDVAGEGVGGLSQVYEQDLINNLKVVNNGSFEAKMRASVRRMEERHPGSVFRVEKQPRKKNLLNLVKMKLQADGGYKSSQTSHRVHQVVPSKSLTARGRRRPLRSNMRFKKLKTKENPKNQNLRNQDRRVEEIERRIIAQLHKESLKRTNTSVKGLNSFRAHNPKSTPRRLKSVPMAQRAELQSRSGQNQAQKSNSKPLHQLFDIKFSIWKNQNEGRLTSFQTHRLNNTASDTQGYQELSVQGHHKSGLALQNFFSSASKFKQFVRKVKAGRRREGPGGPQQNPSFRLKSRNSFYKENLQDYRNRRKVPKNTSFLEKLKKRAKAKQLQRSREGSGGAKHRGSGLEEAKKGASKKERFSGFSALERPRRGGLLKEWSPHLDKQKMSRLNDMDVCLEGGNSVSSFNAENTKLSKSTKVTATGDARGKRRTKFETAVRLTKTLKYGKKFRNG